MSMNLADAFEALSDSLADREALYFEGARLSYAALDERANKVGHFLQSIPIGTNDHVAMHMRNSLEFVEGKPFTPGFLDGLDVGSVATGHIS